MKVILTGVSLQDKGLVLIIIWQSSSEKHVANLGLLSGKKAFSLK